LIPPQSGTLFNLVISLPISCSPLRALEESVFRIRRVPVREDPQPLATGKDLVSSGLPNVPLFPFFLTASTLFLDRFFSRRVRGTLNRLDLVLCSYFFAIDPCDSGFCPELLNLTEAAKPVEPYWY